MGKQTVHILGTVYSIAEVSEKDDSNLEDCDGYCDWTTKEIVVRRERDGTLSDMEAYIRKVKRHEIVHAFLEESGLAECSGETDSWARNEAMVDWIARMGEKIYAAWKEAGAIDGSGCGNIMEKTEEDVAYLRERADRAEKYICMMCAECEWEEHDGIITMQKSCCSLSALDCGKFKARPNWISVEDRLPTIYDADADECVLAIHKTRRRRYYHWQSVADNPFDFTHWMETPHPQKGE